MIKSQIYDLLVAFSKFTCMILSLVAWFYHLFFTSSKKKEVLFCNENLFLISIYFLFFILKSNY
ncbi:hypothetical protein BJ944DRAFT_258751 [Cunninghamella echinulata]|nr:hypothetical protein BJ944DRAFT_258751 [Cunninghamella echinulata]